VLIRNVTSFFSSSAGARWLAAFSVVMLRDMVALLDTEAQNGVVLAGGGKWFGDTVPVLNTSTGKMLPMRTVRTFIA
jgi:hypothetical protein